MARRTVLLSVDGSLLVELDSPERAYAAYRLGKDYSPLTVPPEALLVDAVGHDGRGPYFYRPAVVEAVRASAHAGVDIVWNTRWLTNPMQLELLAQIVGLAGAVRIPDGSELPVSPTSDRVDHAPNVLWEHWKLRALVERARHLPAGAELVVVDTELDMVSPRIPHGVARRARRDDIRLGGIMPVGTRGLDDVAARSLREWATGGDIPRI